MPANLRDTSIREQGSAGKDSRRRKAVLEKSAGKCLPMEDKEIQILRLRFWNFISLLWEKRSLRNDNRIIGISFQCPHSFRNEIRRNQIVSIQGQDVLALASRIARFRAPAKPRLYLA